MIDLIGLAVDTAPSLPDRTSELSSIYYVSNLAVYCHKSMYLVYCNALNLCTDTTKCIDSHYWTLKTETVVNQYRTVRLVLVTPILDLSKASNLSSRSQLGVANNVDQ